MEGYNPTAGCTSGCAHIGNRMWVPQPKSFYPRRDPLIDAYGWTDDPCERPARCGPCCQATPKFRRPKELPECNLDCYREEQQRAKQQEACEEYQKFMMENCPNRCPDPMVIEPLDPENPIAVELPYYTNSEERPPECQFIRRELPCRTNIIAGFFNPDDNKTPEEKLREACDQTYLSCGPNLPLYPCRGVIQYPRIGYTTVAEEMNKCGNNIVCEGSKYCDPQYIQQQMELKRQRECELKMEKQREQEEEEAKAKFFNPQEDHPCCANQKLSLTPYCNCGCDMDNYFKR